MSLLRITNNIYILSGDFFSAVNNSETLGAVYGISTSKGVVLIDCGKPVTGLSMLKETLDYFNVNSPITHCIVTHAHSDHCGSAKELQKLGVKIIVGKEDVQYCLNGGFSDTNTPFGTEYSFPAFLPDIFIENDQTIKIDGISFECIKVPGHTLGSMAIRTCIDDKTVMFTGDILQPEGRGLKSINFGWCGDPFYNPCKIVESMTKLTKYNVDMVLPGHGKVCLRNGTALLRHAAQMAFTTLR